MNKYLLLSLLTLLAACQGEPASNHAIVTEAEVAIEQEQDEPVITPAIAACTASLYDIDYGKDIRQWFDMVAKPENCGGLSLEEQRVAFKQPSLHDDIPTMYSFSLNDLAEDLRAKDIPFPVIKGSKVESWVALNGFYTSSRNLAFDLPQGIEKCAWRVIISKSAKASPGDSNDFALDCKGGLSNEKLLYNEADLYIVVQDIESKMMHWIAPSEEAFPAIKRELVTI